MKNPLDKAIKTCGSQSALAEHLGIKPQAVQQWEFIPEHWALEVERVCVKLASPDDEVITAIEILEYAEKARRRKAAA